MLGISSKKWSLIGNKTYLDDLTLGITKQNLLQMLSAGKDRKWAVGMVVIITEKSFA
jgi:hypothetical protein